MLGLLKNSVNRGDARTAFAASVDRFRDEIQWHYVSPDRRTVNLKRTGAWMRCFEWRGPNLSHAEDVDRGGLMIAANNAFRRLRDRRWAIWFREERRPVADYPTVDCANPAARIIDREREQFFRSGRLFENRAYVAFVYQPPVALLSRMARFAISNAPDAEGLYEREFGAFTTAVDDCLNMLHWLKEEPCLLRAVEGDDLVTFLRGTAQGFADHHGVQMPDWACDISHLLVTQPFRGGLAPTLGWDYHDDAGNLLHSDKEHIRVVTVRHFPTSADPGLLDSIGALPFPLVRSTRWLPRAAEEANADLARAWKIYYQQRKPLMDQAFSAFSKAHETSSRVDHAAAMMTADAEEAQQELAQGLATYGKITTRVVVMDRDAGVAMEQAKAVVSVFNGLGFTALIEDINAAEAFIGTIPGQTDHDVDQPGVSSAALATVIPLSGVWSGPDRCEHLGAPVLIYGATEGGSLRRVDLHYQDVAHTAIVGDSGSGKTFLQNLITLQHLARHKGGRAITFDRKGGAFIPGLCAGASMYDPATQGGVQPFRHLDEPSFLGLPSGVEWAHGWVSDILEDHDPESVKDPNVGRAVFEALSHMAQSFAPDRRTMNAFGMTVQHPWVKEVMSAYTGGHAYGRLFDGVHPGRGLRDSEWSIFALDSLFGQRKAVGPMMGVLCREADRMRRGARGAPIMELYDELWMLDGPFARRIEERVRLARSFNVAIVFATQSVVDLESRTNVIEANCVNRIYTPGKHLRSDHAVALLSRMGLGAGYIEALRHAQPKRHYLIHRPEETALVDFCIPPQGVTAAICTTSQTAIDRAQAMLAEDPESRSIFLSRWLGEQGFPNAGETLKEARDEA